MRLVHSLFPTLLLEFDAFPDEREWIKKAYLSIIEKNVDDRGVSNELTGHVNLHNIPELLPLTAFVGRCVRTFIGSYSVKDELFNLNMVKTWFNISHVSGNPQHHHGDGHISWCYYLNVPETQKRPIYFHNVKRHEPFPGFCDVNVDGPWQEFNSSTWSFMPREGMMLVWPASVPHSVEGPNIVEGIKTAPLEQLRVAIAGDILLSYKKTEAKCLGLQPLEHWKPI